MNKAFLILILTIISSSCWALPERNDSLFHRNDRFLGKQYLNIFNQCLGDSGKFLPDRIIINHRTGQILKGASAPIHRSELDFHEINIRIFDETMTSWNKESVEQLQVEAPVSVGEIVTALLTLAVKPADIISILRIFKQEGALRAELEVR